MKITCCMLHVACCIANIAFLFQSACWQSDFSQSSCGISNYCACIQLQSYRNFKGDGTRSDMQRRFLAQQSITTLLRYCLRWSQHCSHIANSCCAKNRRCESCRVTNTQSQRQTFSSSSTFITCKILNKDILQVF